MIEKLKPCPFCGARDVDVYQSQSKIFPNEWFVSCHGCCADKGNHVSKKEAIEAWNKRAPMSCEELYDHLDGCKICMRNLQ